MMNNKFFPLIAVTVVFLLTACGNKQVIRFSDDTEEVTVSSDVTHFDKTIAGEAVAGDNSIFDCTAVYSKENYSIITAKAYGDNGIVVLYSGINGSRVVTYAISDGREAESVTLDGVTFSGEAVINSAGADIIYIYDNANNSYYSIDFQQNSYTGFRFDYEVGSMYIAYNGERIYYTLNNDCTVYQYILETGNSVPVYDYAGSADYIEIRYVENDNDKIILSITKDGITEYRRLSIVLQEDAGLDISPVNVLFAGETYAAPADTDEPAVYVYNTQKPRTLEIFYLDDVKELDNMYLFPGSPYLMTFIKQADGSLMRFYNVSRGIKCNETVLPEEYLIKGASYISIDQTMCIIVNKADGETGIIMWDIEAVNDVVE